MQHSDQARSALEQLKRLPYEELSWVLSELRVNVILQAWSISDCVPEGTASRPKRTTTKVSLGVLGQGSASSLSVVGCPWCRRPVEVKAIGRDEVPNHLIVAPTAGQQRSKFAYTTLLYGPRCHRYFLGALVLGHGLQRFGGSSAERLLMHTPDVPVTYINALTLAGWSCREVEYIKDVSFAFFHNWKSRFLDVFTKLRLLQLTDFDKVLFLDLDMLVRREAMDVESLESLFDVEAPAAMTRGDPVPRHGEVVPYSRFWSYLKRRTKDKIPVHQQCSGINAGLMLLKPDEDLFNQALEEVNDRNHPEHYATYMPEQEYLGRLYGTFDTWRHISCRFNFEIDKNERVPVDFTEAHEVIRQQQNHAGAAILHYSGTNIKPWDLIFTSSAETAGLKVSSSSEVSELLSCLKKDGFGNSLENCIDKERLWSAMLEWVDQLEAVSSDLLSKGCDVIKLVAEECSSMECGDTASETWNTDQQWWNSNEWQD